MDGDIELSIEAKREYIIVADRMSAVESGGDDIGL